MSHPIYNFVSVWTVDDLPRPPARPPVVSSDLYASPGSVLTSISTIAPPVSTISTFRTTNLTSQDCYVSLGLPLSVVNTKGISITTPPSEANIPAAGAFVNSGGVFSTLTVAAALLSDFQ
jgi:hypothetical protein